jgi:hypothetical protein
MLKKLQKEKPSGSILGGIGAAPFETRAAAALGISVVADALDYAGAPIFALPVIGDVADVFVSGILYSITKSKKATAINALEFIPVIGDFIPAYTISTLLWIRQESSKRKKMQKMRKDEEAGPAIDHEKMTFAKSINKVASYSRNNAENIRDEYLDPGSTRRINEVKEEKEMKKLVASRYARWKEGKYQ